MASGLVSTIALLVPVLNQNPVVQPPRPTYDCVTYGGNLTPHQFQLAPGNTTTTLGNITVPNAFIGATGTYPLETVRWDFSNVMQNFPSQVEVSGVVQYVTVQTSTQIYTTQRYNMTYRWVIASAPLDPPVMSLDGKAPITTLSMPIHVGTVNLVTADEEHAGAAFNEKDVVEMEQVVTQQHEIWSSVKSRL